MIGIKDMEMPKCCDDCRLIEELPAFEKKYCGANYISLKRIKTSEKRHPQCPLVEIRGGEE